jgi:hypothetical protein
VPLDDLDARANDDGATAANANETPASPTEQALAIVAGALSDAPAATQSRWSFPWRKNRPPDLIAEAPEPTTREGSDDAEATTSHAEGEALMRELPATGGAVDDAGDAGAVDDAGVEEVEDFGEDDLLANVLGVSPERLREIASHAQESGRDAHIEPDIDPVPVTAAANGQPEPSATTQPTIEDLVAQTREAVEAARQRASAWACEITGARRPVSVERRRSLLSFYVMQMENDPEARAIVERVATEDPELGPDAKRALVRAA